MGSNRDLLSTNGRIIVEHIRSNSKAYMLVYIAVKCILSPNKKRIDSKKAEQEQIYEVRMRNIEHVNLKLFFRVYKTVECTFFASD